MEWGWLWLKKDCESGNKAKKLYLWLIILLLNKVWALGIHIKEVSETIEKEFEKKKKNFFASFMYCLIVVGIYGTHIYTYCSQQHGNDNKTR